MSCLLYQGLQSHVVSMHTALRYLYSQVILSRFYFYSHTFVKIKENKFEAIYNLINSISPRRITDNLLTRLQIK